MASALTQIDWWIASSWCVLHGDVFSKSLSSYAGYAGFFGIAAALWTFPPIVEIRIVSERNAFKRYRRNTFAIAILTLLLYIGSIAVEALISSQAAIADICDKKSVANAAFWWVSSYDVIMVLALTMSAFFFRRLFNIKNRKAD